MAQKKQIISIPNSPAPIAPYSQAVIAQGMFYASGQIAIDPATGEMQQTSIEAETHQVMKNVQSLLAAGQLTWDDVVKCTIFLRTMDDYGTVNEIYGQYFDRATAPARECVAVAGLPRNARVEMSVIAAV